jgi:PAS domain S-box-containing protein
MVKKGKNKSNLPLISNKQIDEIVKTMLDNVAIGVSMIDPKMEIVWLNETFKKWFPHIDINKKPLCYQSFYLPPKDKVCDYCPTIKAFKTHRRHSAETSVCADGKIYNVIATPIQDKKGEVNYVVETVEDITERKKAEDNLEKTHRFLQSIIDGVAHPIMVIADDYCTAPHLSNENLLSL